MNRIVIIIALMFALIVSAPSQDAGLYSIGLTGTFTTTSRLFYNPDSPDGYERSRNLAIDNVFGFGIDLRRRIGTSGVVVGLACDYLRGVETFSIPVTQQASVPVRDGFEAIPIEASGYFVIPFSSDQSLLYIGAGVGIYFGKRIFEKAGAASESMSHNPGAGIHVLTGFEYRMTPSLGIRTEVKFRDVSFKATNRFSSSTTVYNGRIVDLGTSVTTSRLNIDGMELVAGLVYIF